MQELKRKAHSRQKAEQGLEGERTRFLQGLLGVPATGVECGGGGGELTFQNPTGPVGRMPFKELGNYPKSKKEQLNRFKQRAIGPDLH